MNLCDLLKRQNNNKKVAIKHGTRSISYQDWFQKSKAIAGKIEKVASKCVAIFLPNSIDYAIAYFGILFAERIVVPIGVELREKELASILEYCEIDLVVTNKKYSKIIKEMLINYVNRIDIYIIDENGIDRIKYKAEYVNKVYKWDSREMKTDVAIMLHTSGTISSPKRVMLTHENLFYNIESNIKSLELTGNDSTIIYLPMHFGYCNTAQFLTHLYLGALIIISKNIFFPKQFLENVQNEKITNFVAVPSMLLMLLNFRYNKKYNIESLKYICFGGGRISVTHLEKIIKKYPSIGFIHTYGQTEASPRISALLKEDSRRKIGSVGKSIPNIQIEIINGEKKPCKINEVGHIIIKGKNVMKGYFKREDLTKKTIIDGWLLTGDLGYFDQDGYLFLSGRKKNIIISGGINIYPEEIEEVLLNHKNIKEAYVFSVEHDLLGEVPHAKIVVKNSDITECKEYRRYCNKYLAKYKVPSKIEIVENLHKTYSGKIKRIWSEEKMSKIRIGIIGVGNCASSLLQGIEYYKNKTESESVGLMHWKIGIYKPSDIEIVLAYDIDQRKVGVKINDAIFAKPNCTKIFNDKLPNESIIIKMGKILDGYAAHFDEYEDDHSIRLSSCKEPTKEEVIQDMIDSKVDIILNYLPVGSELATKFYVECSLEANKAFINNIPVFIASDEAWASKFKNKNIPIIGDDIKSQIGATIIHRCLAELFSNRGVSIERSYQLNFGGNTDFLNMLDNKRVASKKTSKTEAVKSICNINNPNLNLHVGPSDYVAWKEDNKVCFLRLEGKIFGDISIEFEGRLSVEDSPNSAGVTIDAIRCCKLALDNGIGGVLLGPSSYFCKHPLKQLIDSKAFDEVEKFIESNSK